MCCVLRCVDVLQSTLPMSLLTYKGDLIISLKFASSEQKSSGKRGGTVRGSLHVLIKQARNLTAVRSNGSSDPFCKGYVDRRSTLLTAMFSVM